MIATLGLALLAGVLSILSPCVLPLLPIVLGTAQSEHRLGPVALAADSQVHSPPASGRAKGVDQDGREREFSLSVTARCRHMIALPTPVYTLEAPLSDQQALVTCLERPDEGASFLLTSAAVTIGMFALGVTPDIRQHALETQGVMSRP